MSSEWFQTTLGEICAIQKGAIQTGPFGSQLHASDYVETGIPVVMPANIIPDGGISEEGIARITQEDADRLSQHKLQIGDVVFSRRGDVTRNALIEPNQVGWLCGTGCLKVRLGNEETADAKFISYCLRLPETKEWLVRHAVGATMPNLNTSILSAVPILIPPIPEQKKITSFLRALDDRINLLRETNATLEAIAQALFKSWFVDFDPVHANAGTKAPSLPPEIQALFPTTFTDSPQGPIPEGWQVMPFGDFIERMSVGKKFDQKSALEEGSIPILDQGRSGIIGFHNETPGVKASLEEPVVVFANHTCYMRLITFDFSAIQNVLPFIGKGVDTVWAFYATKDRIQFSEYKGHWPDFAIEKSVVPPKTLTELYRSNIDSIIRSTRNNELQIEALSKLRDTLLPRLISGQLRLSEATQELSEVL